MHYILDYNKVSQSKENYKEERTYLQYLLGDGGLCASGWVQLACLVGAGVDSASGTGWRGQPGSDPTLTPAPLRGTAAAVVRGQPQNSPVP